MMKIAICDDNKDDIILFKGLCNAYCHQNNKLIEIVSYFSGEELLKEFNSKKYDVVFLDIYMKEMTGIETAKEIRKLDEDIKLIFTTTSNEHYSDGFEVEATHYLIKPLTEDKISQVMYRLRNLFDENEALLILKSGVKTIEILQNTIMYIETIRNGIEVHCKHEVFAIRTPLSKVANQLNGSCFLQCHRYSIVNLKEVVSITNDAFIMSDGKRILIRKVNQKEMEQEYHNFRVTQLRSEVK